MLEIFILCEYPTLNGGERSMLATLDGARAAGFSPVLVAPPEGPLADEAGNRGIELLAFQCRQANGSRVAQEPLRERLAEILRRRRPALLHANSLAMGRLSGPVAVDCGVPSVSHIRDIVGLSRQAVADLNRHRRLLAVSKATRDFHVAQGVDAKKVHVLHNGVDLDRFQPRSATGYLHRELQIAADVRLVGNIGQIGLRKGQDVLLRAAASLADHWPAVHYVLIGERNSDKDESRQFERSLHEAASGSLAGRVHFLGRRMDVPQLLNELTLLVHTARQEPLGRVLLEAAAAGVPVVATDAGGTKEIFPSEAAASLRPVDDASAIAAAIADLLEDDRRRKSLGEAARRRAEEAFDIRKAVTGLVAHYRELTASE